MSNSALIFIFLSLITTYPHGFGLAAKQMLAHDSSSVYGNDLKARRKPGDGILWGLQAQLSLSFSKDKQLEVRRESVRHALSYKYISTILSRAEQWLTFRFFLRHLGLETYLVQIEARNKMAPI